MEIGTLKQLEEILGYAPTHANYFTQALTHPSHAFEQGRTGDNYQRLEFLGDAVLGMLLAEQLYIRFPDAAEGELSRFRAALAGEGALASIARSLGVGQLILLGRGERLTAGEDKDSLLADVLEALIAAVYLDGGIEAARNLVVLLFSDLLSTPLESTAALDPKSSLQETLSARQLPPPCYCQTGESGPPHERIFTFAVMVEDETLGEGSGRSKKIAQQAAASIALQNLQNFRQ